jgi:hypothetical protein
MHLEDESLLAAVRLRELDLPVEPARPEQRRVERVLPVRRHDHLHAAIVRRCECTAQRHDST